MKIYKDSSLNEEISQTLDFGVVQAGDTKEYSYCIYNETNAELVELSFIISNKEVEILDYPKKLLAKTHGTLKIKYSPSVDIKKGLKTLLEFKGIEVYS